MGCVSSKAAEEGTGAPPPRPEHVLAPAPEPVVSDRPADPVDTAGRKYLMYTCMGCPPSLIVRLAFAVHRVPLDVQVVDDVDRAPELLEANPPFGETPTVRITAAGEAKPTFMKEALDIVKYLDETYASASGAARLVRPDVAPFAPLLQRLFPAMVAAMRNKNELKTPALLDALSDVLREFAAAYKGPYLAGDAVCVADLRLFVIMWRIEVLLTHYRGYTLPADVVDKLGAWRATMRERFGALLPQEAALRSYAERIFQPGVVFAMQIVHFALRAGAARIGEALKRVAGAGSSGSADADADAAPTVLEPSVAASDDARAAADEIAAFLACFAQHAKQEDNAMFPMLERLKPGITRMVEAQHVELHPLETRLAAAAAGARDTAAGRESAAAFAELRAAWEAFEPKLEPHLALEEQLLPPLVTRMTQRQQKGALRVLFAETRGDADERAFFGYSVARLPSPGMRDMFVQRTFGALVDRRVALGRAVHAFVGDKEYAELAFRNIGVMPSKKELA